MIACHPHRSPHPAIHSAFTNGEGAAATLHVHHGDDEAWHVLEGELTFRYSDRTETAGAGRRCLCLPDWRTPIPPAPTPDI